MQSSHQINTPDPFYFPNVVVRVSGSVVVSSRPKAS